MSKISILHFSDVHWHSKNEESVEIVRNAMVDDIKKLQSEEGVQFDIVLFTGDLVLAGENREDFDYAHDAVLRPILDAIGLDEDRLFICPGNHDASRKLVRDTGFIEQGLMQSLNSVDTVNALFKKLDKGDESSKLALARMSNFDDYHGKKYRAASAQSGTAKIYKPVINGVTLGIACFDNSWRATGEAGGVTEII